MSSSVKLFLENYLSQQDFPTLKIKICENNQKCINLTDNGKNTGLYLLGSDIINTEISNPIIQNIPCVISEDNIIENLFINGGVFENFNPKTNIVSVSDIIKYLELSSPTFIGLQSKIDVLYKFEEQTSNYKDSIIFGSPDYIYESGNSVLNYEEFKNLFTKIEILTENEDEYVGCIFHCDNQKFIMNVESQILQNPEILTFKKNLKSNNISLEFFDPRGFEKDFPDGLIYWIRDKYDSYLNDENLGKLKWGKGEKLEISLGDSIKYISVCNLFFENPNLGQYLEGNFESVKQYIKISLPKMEDDNLKNTLWFMIKEFINKIKKQVKKMDLFDICFLNELVLNYDGNSVKKTILIK